MSVLTGVKNYPNCECQWCDVKGLIYDNIDLGCIRYSILIHEKYSQLFFIPKAIEVGESVSQRELSSQMEINISSVHYAMKNLIQMMPYESVAERN